MNLLNFKKLKINRKNAFWCIFYGVLIVFGGQIFIHFLYKDLSDKNIQFVCDEIKSEKIVDIDTLSFTPGKGNYNEIELSSSKKYPIFLENYDYENLITINSTIQKKSNKNEFTIINESKNYKFKINNLIVSSIPLRLFILIGTLLVAISTFSRYGIERNKKT